MQNHVVNLITKFKDKNIYSHNGERLDEEEMSDGNIKTSCMVYTTQVRLSEKPHFFKVLKKARNIEKEVIEREPDVSNALMMMKKHAKEQTIS